MIKVPKLRLEIDAAKPQEQWWVNDGYCYMLPSHVWGITPVYEYGREFCHVWSGANHYNYVDLKADEMAKLCGYEE